MVLAAQQIDFWSCETTMETGFQHLAHCECVGAIKVAPFALLRT